MEDVSGKMENVIKHTHIFMEDVSGKMEDVIKYTHKYPYFSYSGYPGYSQTNT